MTLFHIIYIFENIQSNNLKGRDFFICVQGVKMVPLLYPGNNYKG